MPQSFIEGSSDNPPTSRSTRNSYPLLLPARLEKIPHKIRLLGGVAFFRNFVALGFWNIPGAFSVVGEFGRVGRRRGPSTLKTRTKWPPSSAQEAKTLLEIGTLCGNFFGWWDLVFAGGFGENGGWTWFFCGQAVVDCW
jgi:hypothetical protein